VRRVPILQSPLAITAMGIAAMGVAAIVTVRAGVPTSPSSSSGSGQVRSTCSLTAPPNPSASPPPTSAPNPEAKATGMVGVILADTTCSTRCTLFDSPLLQKVFDTAGITSDIRNAHGDPARFEQIAQSMIAEGVKVLIIDSTDQASGSAVEHEADAAGVEVIDHDGADLGGSASCYVSFDDLGAGRLH
jgi:hypothetical protein